jgi:molybdopterin-containing oxidoreductase family molybdopterin binding subunit
MGAQEAGEARTKEVAVKERVVRTVCSPNCGQTCLLWAYVREGKLVKTEPAPFPDPEYNRICLKGLSHVQRLYHPKRLLYPLKRIGERGEGKWQRISWEEALEAIGDQFQQIKKKYGPKSLAFFGMSGNYGLLNGGYGGLIRFASLIGGTVPIGGVDTAIPQGFGYVTGVPVFGVGGNEPLDIVNARTILVWGSSMGESWIHTAHFIFDARDKGAKLVVIDPRFSTIASKADTWLSLNPGSDIALALSLIEVIMREELYDKEFLLRRTVAPFLVRKDNKLFLREKDIQVNGSSESYMMWDTLTAKPCPYNQSHVKPALFGTYIVKGIECTTAFQLLRNEVRPYSPERAAQTTGISAQAIIDIARDLATRRPGGVIYGYGADRYYHANRLGHALATLLALTGNYGKSGAIPGTYVGPFLETLNPAWLFPTGTPPAYIPMAQFYDLLDTGDPYPVKALYVSCGNLLNQMPHRNRWINKLFPKLELIVVAEQFLTDTARYADIVLPTAHWFEAADLVPAFSLPYLFYREKVLEPLAESKPDFAILQGLAKKLGIEKYFQGSPEDHIKQIVDTPFFKQQGVTWERLKQEGVVRVYPKPHITFQDRFQTPSGRLEFYVEKLVTAGEELPRHSWPLEASPNAPLATKYPLILNTQHGRWRVHSQFVDLPWLEDLQPVPRVEIHPLDAHARGIKDNDIVEVYNDRGKVKLKALLNPAIKPGMINIQQGWWGKHYLEGHHQELTHEKTNPLTLNLSFFDVRVEVKKIIRIRDERAEIWTCY